MAINTYRPTNLRHFMRATSQAHGEHEMIHDERARLCICAFNLYRPLLRFRILRGPRDCGGCPHVQFQSMRIALEPICKLPHFISMHVIGEITFIELLLGQVDRLAKSVGSCRHKELDEAEAKSTIESTYGKYGMWSYPNGDLSNGEPQKRSAGRTNGVM